MERKTVTTIQTKNSGKNCNPECVLARWDGAFYHCGLTGIQLPCGTDKPRTKACLDAESEYNAIVINSFIDSRKQYIDRCKALSEVEQLKVAEVSLPKVYLKLHEYLERIQQLETELKEEKERTALCKKDES